MCAPKTATWWPPAPARWMARIRELEDQIAAVKAEAASLQLVDGFT